MQWYSYDIKYALELIHLYNSPWGVFYILVHQPILIVFAPRSLKYVQCIGANVYVSYALVDTIINKCTGSFSYGKHWCM